MSQSTSQEVVHPSLSFTETMKGFVNFSELDGGQAALQDVPRKMALLVHLTIEIDHIEQFTRSITHQAAISGYVECEALGGKLPIEKGIFQLFLAEVASANTRMWYRLFFHDPSGRRLSLIGFKVLPGKMGLNVWQATTTLFVSVLAGEEDTPTEGEQGQTIASGIISLHFVDFLHQLASFRARGSTRRKGVEGMCTFFFFFVQGLWKAYYRAWKSHRHI
ncbi:hypothetical protein [Ktedonospora formicarum]|uniref:Uncharacterized protein n=1 Tax=Ktedonospora formicarum TaxID=2778364 RepID=A0A8J3MYQ6_9CHLR|nr:hypothetical protein [Ktedonospora formicarum]GHO51191.1 hypothetical protein KSX_93540 [Ktedonospora formicarum]